MGLEDMTGTMRRVLGAFVMTLAVLPFVAYQGVAQAADSTVTVDIGAGANGDKVGTATFTLSATTLTIDTTLDAGVTLDEDAKACVDDAPFTSRIPPGQCQFSSATGDFSIALADVSPALTGNMVCAQVHYTVTDGSEGGEGGQTAYAGHQPSDTAFYGNVCLEIPTTTTTTPPPNTSTPPTSSSPPTSSTPPPSSSTPPASVLPTEATTTAAEETDVAVEGTKSGGSGELAETGAGLPLGTALAIALGLLLAGAALMFVPRHLAVERGTHRRRH
jgi:hypothetical protein